MRIKTVFVALADLQTGELAQFYRQLFGCEPTAELPQYIEFELPGLRLGIFQPKPDQDSEFTGKAGRMSLCVEVEQLEEAMQRLQQIGYLSVLEVMTASHGREVYVYDPAGNRLILHQQV